MNSDWPLLPSVLTVQVSWSLPDTDVWSWGVSSMRVYLQTVYGRFNKVKNISRENLTLFIAERNFGGEGNLWFILYLCLFIPFTGGKYCDRSNLTSPTEDCAPGYYCSRAVDTATPSGNNTGVGAICPEGHYCPGGTDYPIGCSAGTYQVCRNKNLLIMIMKIGLVSDVEVCCVKITERAADGSSSESLPDSYWV